MTLNANQYSFKFQHVHGEQNKQAHFSEAIHIFCKFNGIYIHSQNYARWLEYIRDIIYRLCMHEIIGNTDNSKYISYVNHNNIYIYIYIYICIDEIMINTDNNKYIDYILY